MDAIWQDMKYALRTLAKRPGFTAVAVLTLALGIGATTAIFGLVNGVLLESLPYEDPERLLDVFDHQPGYGNAPVSYPEYLDWKQHAEVFEQVAAYFPMLVNLAGDGEPARLDAARVSANLLPTLGVHPLLGRGFTTDDEPAGAAPVVLISHGFWKNRLGDMQDPIGHILSLDGESYTVAGVLPPEARYSLPMDLAGGPGRELWLPLRLDPETSPREMHFLAVLGRLAPGVSVEQAEREIEALSGHLQETSGDDHGIRLANLAQGIVGDARPRLQALMAAVGLVLLIGCANIANLLLARASTRRAEIAIRLAVGASRGRLVRQLVTESIALAVVGGALGVAGAAAGLRWFAAARFADLPRVAEVGLDATVLGFACFVTLLTAALFGLVPAHQSASTHLTDAFRDAGRQGGAGQDAPRLRGLLVVAEVALSVVLLVGAGLLLRSFVSLTDVELGFQPDGVMTSGLLLPEARYPEAADQVRFFDQAVERLRTIPGVEGVALVNSLPVLGGSSGDFEIEGHTWPEGDSPYTEKRRVSADYFRIMGIPLERGRFFTEQDTADSPHVILVNREFVRRFMPEADPIGRRIGFGWNAEDQLQEIVGVVGDERHRGLAQDIQPAMYVPYRQNAQSFMQVVLSSGLEAQSLRAAVRRQLAAIDPSLPVTEVRAMNDLIARTLAQPRLATGLLSGFAAAALLLAMLGIYGVMSYSATQRTQEMGIRMALGAGRWRVTTLILNQGLKLAGIGMALGVVGSIALTRFLSELLFGVTATDPLTYALVVPLLFTVVATACFLPARRASRVDPIVALHHD